MDRDNDTDQYHRVPIGTPNPTGGRGTTNGVPTTVHQYQPVKTKSLPK